MRRLRASTCSEAKKRPVAASGAGPVGLAAERWTGVSAFAGVGAFGAIIFSSQPNSVTRPACSLSGHRAQRSSFLAGAALSLQPWPNKQPATKSERVCPNRTGKVHPSRSDIGKEHAECRGAVAASAFFATASGRPLRPGPQWPGRTGRKVTRIGSAFHAVTEALPTDHGCGCQFCGGGTTRAAER